MSNDICYCHWKYIYTSYISSLLWLSLKCQVPEKFIVKSLNKKRTTLWHNTQWKYILFNFLQKKIQCSILAIRKLKVTISEVSFIFRDIKECQNNTYIKSRLILFQIPSYVLNICSQCHINSKQFGHIFSSFNWVFTVQTKDINKYTH